MNDGIVIEHKPNIVIYGVDQEDGEWFQKNLKAFSGNAGKRLFKEMINRFHMADLLVELLHRVDELEKIVNKEEEKEEDIVKAMGGKKYVKATKVSGTE